MAEETLASPAHLVLVSRRAATGKWSATYPSIPATSIGSSVEDARLVRGDHVLDVDEGVLAAVQLKHLERLDDQVAERLALLLRVVDAVAEVEVAVLEDVEDREDLP